MPRQTQCYNTSDLKMLRSLPYESIRSHMTAMLESGSNVRTSHSTISLLASPLRVIFLPIVLFLFFRRLYPLLLYMLPYRTVLTQIVCVFARHLHWFTVGTKRRLHP